MHIRGKRHPYGRLESYRLGRAILSGHHLASSQPSFHSLEEKSIAVPGGLFLALEASPFSRLPTRHKSLRATSHIALTLKMRCCWGAGELHTVMGGKSGRVKEGGKSTKSRHTILSGRAVLLFRFCSEFFQDRAGSGGPWGTRVGKYFGGISRIS